MARTSVQFGPAHACLEGRQQGWERLLPPAALRPEAQPHTWGQLLYRLGHSAVQRV